MEMWLNRLCLLFLTAAVGAMEISGQETVIVSEVQRTAVVPLGSSVTFHCRLKIKTDDRFRLTWYFDPSGASFNDSYKIIHEEIINKSAKSSFNETKWDSKDGGNDGTLSIYSIYNASDKHRGWYFCKVTEEIPILKLYDSKGTHVVIMKSMEHATYPSLPIVTGKQATVSPTDSQPVEWWIWIMLAVAALVLIILLVLSVLLRRRCRRNTAEDPIYANTRPMANQQPSPRPGMPLDNLKEVSPYQNLRNPSPNRRYEDGKRRHRP